VQFGVPHLLPESAGQRSRQLLKPEFVYQLHRVVPGAPGPSDQPPMPNSPPAPNPPPAPAKKRGPTTRSMAQPVAKRTRSMAK